MNKKPICIEKTAYKTPVLKTLTVKVEGIICGSGEFEIDPLEPENGNIFGDNS